jgi:acetylornithine deacetylase/succinyl-diaminopimelate desuccinylase-like protein
MPTLNVCVSATFLVCSCLVVPVHAQVALPPAERTLAREVLQELIQIQTTEADGATPRAAQAMADRLIAAGFPREDVQVLALNPKTASLIARMRGNATTVKPILLMAHIDVVPARREDWSLDPWTFVERDGYFYGRGTTDNKAGAATLVATFIRMKREGWRPRRDLILALTGDEETSGASIQWLLAEHRPLVDAEFALNTDSGGIIEKGGRLTLFTVQASEKIYADYQLEITDVGGHSSLARSENPITTLSAALVRLAEHRFPTEVTEVARLFFERSARVETGQVASDMRAVAGAKPDPDAASRLSANPFYNARLRTTCVTTRIEGGHANNALPQLARANVNCRILPGTSTADVEATVRRLAGPKVTVTVAQQPTPSPPSPLTPAVLGSIERLVTEAWPGLTVAPVMEAGATDGLHVRKAGIPTYGVSALAENPDDVRAHGKDERVGVEAFYQATEFWYRMLKTFAGP